MVILLASACKVVRFDYYVYGGFTDWEADNWVQAEFGPDYSVWDGTVYDPFGEAMFCSYLDEDGYYWEVFGVVYDSEGPLYCGNA